MTSHPTKRFREAFAELPLHVQRKAGEAYHLWQHNPQHPGLQFKQVHTREPISSVRVGIGWRAVGVKSDDTMVWFWIGSHADYDKLLSKL